MNTKELENYKEKYKTYKPKTKDGWTEWVSPIMKNYHLKCCDCGLVHEFQFKVVFLSQHEKKSWKTIIDDKSFEIIFRCRRK